MTNASPMPNFSDPLWYQEWIHTLKGDHLWNNSEDHTTEHPVDDSVFRERLDRNMLTEEEHQAWIEHLTHCAYCCRVMTGLVECDLLFSELPEMNISSNESVSESNDTSPSTIVTIRQRLQSIPMRRWMIFVTAILCLCVTMFLWYPSPRERIRREMLASLDAKNINCSTRLTDNGYRINGTTWIKSIPMVNVDSSTLQKCEEMIRQTPNDVAFRVDFSKFLLFGTHDPQRAFEELKESKNLSLTPDGMQRMLEIHLLIGLAAFEMEDDVTAQEAFRRALDLDAKNIDAQLNLAISLYRSGDATESRKWLEDLLLQEIPESLREQIVRHLDQTE